MNTGGFMKIVEMKELMIGNLKAKLPIVQGGMGIGVSLSNLASAVANQGGIGVISAAGAGMFEKNMATDFERINIEALRQEIRKAREKSKGILGVNIMVALTSFSQMVKTSIEEGIDIIFSGAGLPLDLPKYLKEKSKTKLVPIISSARAAKLLIRKWAKNYSYVPDAFVLEGPKAGGHLGYHKEDIEKEEFQLESVLPEVLEIIKPFEEKYNKKIPVIVAGGIYTGEDIAKFIDQGASGVQMATRFIATEECDADMKFKQQFIDCKEEDLKLITSPVGMPGRAIFNDYIQAVEDGKKHPFTCPFDCIHTCEKQEAPYCISLALYNAKKGNLKSGFAFAGTNAYRIDNITTVPKLVNELKEQYSDYRNKN